MVVAAYLAGMIALSAWLGVGQRSRSDYYLGPRRLSPLSLASSSNATQCSTNSLLGAPAFVGFAVGGGLLWLQYELAVPLAMLAVMFLMIPMRRSGVISVYEFLERRLGLGARLVASLSFQLFRGVATGVTVYGVALVLTLIMDVTFLQAVLLLMGVSIGHRRAAARHGPSSRGARPGGTYTRRGQRHAARRRSDDPADLRCPGQSAGRDLIAMIEAAGIGLRSSERTGRRRLSAATTAAAFPGRCR